jgi:hypothetical protein
MVKMQMAQNDCSYLTSTDIDTVFLQHLGDVLCDIEDGTEHIQDREDRRREVLRIFS